MEKFRLSMFFCEMINLMYRHPGRPGFGNPVSWLIEQMCVYNEKFFNRILGDYSGESHECRLNNAGLKFHWSVDRSGSTPRFRCHISGDQAKDYPDFVEAATELIQKYGYQKDSAIRWRNIH